MLRIDIVVGIGTSRDEYSLDLLSEITIRYFAKSSDIVFYRQFIHDEKFARVISDDDISPEEIVIVPSTAIPRRDS